MESLCEVYKKGDKVNDVQIVIHPCSSSCIILMPWIVFETKKIKIVIFQTLVSNC